MVAEGDHGLDHPEDGLVVSQQVLSGDRGTVSSDYSNVWLQ